MTTPDDAEVMIKIVLSQQTCDGYRTAAAGHGMDNLTNQEIADTVTNLVGMFLMESGPHLLAELRRLRSNPDVYRANMVIRREH